METSNVRNILSTPSYSSLFEYASEIVRNYIETEKEINIGNLENLFGDESWFSNFFNCNLKQILKPEVRAVLEKRLEQGEPYNTQLARVDALYSTVCMAVGGDVVEQMIKNLSFSIIGSKVKGRNETEDFLMSHPVLLISALGNIYFGKERMLFRQRRGWQKSNTAHTGG